MCDAVFEKRCFDLYDFYASFMKLIVLEFYCYFVEIHFRYAHR